MSSPLKTFSPPAQSETTGEENNSPTTLQLLAHLVEQTSDILIAADVNYKPLTWNKASERIFGLEAKQVIGKDLRKILDLHHNNHSNETITDIVKRHGEWRGEVYFERPSDGRTITLLVDIKELNQARDKTSGYLISGTDISERKEIEEKLRESEQRFKDIADSSPAMIWLSNENEITVYANKKWLSLRVSRSALTRKDGVFNTPGRPANTTEAYFKQYNEKRQITIVYRLRRADGVYRWVHDQSVPRFSNTGKFIGYHGFCH